MNEKQIDVLAVLDTACKLHKEGAYADAWEVDLARIYDVRAAVAELMEAADVLTDAITFRIDDPRHALLDRVVKALARVRSS